MNEWPRHQNALSQTNVYLNTRGKWLPHIAASVCTIALSMQTCVVIADDGSSMTDTAKVAQAIQVKLHPMVQLPLSYNYNQNRQPNQNYTQAQFQFFPVIPFVTSERTGIILMPMLTDNINAQNQQTRNQATPVQLSTFFAKTDTDLLYGVGPFIQVPTANTYGGSQQTGLGASYGLMYQPKHWVIGVIGYNAWGIGNNVSAGTANVYYANPAISYTTDNAWTYTLQSWVNGNPTNGQSNNTNQMMLSGGQTFTIGSTSVQWQIGPSYMVTKTPNSPQGWGGYFSLTVAFPEKGYYIQPQDYSP